MTSKKNDPKAPGSPSDSTNGAGQAYANGVSSDYPFPFAIQIGEVTTLGEVMAGNVPFKAKHTLVNPTSRELLDHCRKEMERPRPELPNNGFPEGTCAGCGAESGKEGESLQQCARCKGRRYCGRKCQKKDWAMHKSDCVQV